MEKNKVTAGDYIQQLVDPVLMSKEKLPRNLEKSLEVGTQDHQKDHQPSRCRLGHFP